MSAYFLEFVRSSYKLPTGLLNEDFIRMLHYKSGVPEKEVADIVTFIKYLEQGESVNEKQLASFHKRLESFYQKA
jgi:dsDNA-specific endonuclease/ATPase MutS2